MSFYHIAVIVILVGGIGIAGARVSGIPVFVYLPMMIVVSGFGAFIASAAWALADWLSGKQG